jgi:hypothetical protein
VRLLSRYRVFARIEGSGERAPREQRTLRTHRKEANAVSVPRSSSGLEIEAGVGNIVTI